MGGLLVIHAFSGQGFQNDQGLALAAVERYQVAGKGQGNLKTPGSG